MLNFLKIYFVLLFISSSSMFAISPEYHPSSAQIPTSTREDPQLDTLTENLKKTLDNYDRKLPPSHFGPPLQISTSLYIADIPWTSEVDMEISVDMFLLQSWVDPRLQLTYNITPHDYLPFGYEFEQNIWTPDTYFPNEKHSNLHAATAPNKYFRLYSSGKVASSIHLTLTSSCPMNLVYFPMDYQICRITVESYAYDESRVRYEWDSGPWTKFSENAIGLLQNYQLTAYRQRKGVRVYTTGNYTSLMSELLLSRHLSYYVMQMYLPIALTVVISWFPFWMEGHTDWERITIGVTTILTMTSLVRSIQQNSPKVSYITAMDVYTQMSFFMTFVSLLESTIVGYLYKKNDHKPEVTDMQLFRGPGMNAKPNFIRSRKLRHSVEMSARIDSTCRIVVPVGFGLFNVAYWAYYLSVSAIQNDPSWVRNLHAQSLYNEYETYI